MGADFDLRINQDGQPQLLYIDKGKEKLDIGNKLSDFRIEKELGKGNFGSVYLVTSKLTNKLYAMKEIKSERYNNEEERLKIQKEVKSLENLNHPHVITYFSSFNENGNFYIITEYINGVSLEQLIKRVKEKGLFITEKNIWDFLVQILSGLFYLHEEKRIIHGNIKLENILYDKDKNLKISDFGISAMNNKNVEEMKKCHGIPIGSFKFLPPELINNGTYDFKSDIYMLGLAMLNLVQGKLPEENGLNNENELYFTLNKSVHFPNYYSDDIKNFIKDLLTVNKNERPSTKDAFNGALSFYTVAYLKTTSIITVLQCFYSIPTMKDYFNSDEIQEYIKNDKHVRNYLSTKEIKWAFNYINSNNFNYNEVKIQALRLRLLYYAGEEKYRKMTEIEVGKVIDDICNNLHKELNKNKSLKNEREPGSNNLNEELINYKEESIDESDEQKVRESACKRYQERYRSKISDLIYFLSNTTYQCPHCNNHVKTSINFCYAFVLYPERAFIWLGQKKLTIYNLFQHCCKKKLFTDMNQFCKNCDKIQKDVKIFQQFYFCPLNLILLFDYPLKYNFILQIEEFIDISDFVIRKDINNPKYRLIGAIFTEKKDNMTKYVSYTKDSNGEWKYFNGKSYENSNLTELQNHENIEVLFYTSL